MFNDFQSAVSWNRLKPRSTLRNIMAMEIVRADSGMDAIIWLILGAFWLIAQAIAKFRGGGREPRPPPILTGEKSIEEDLKTLFEQLSGQGADHAAADLDASTPSTANPMKPIPYGAVRRLPKPPHPKHKTAGRFEPVQVMPQPAVVAAQTTPEVHEIPTLSIARSRGGMLKESMFSFNAIKTPLPAAKPLGVNLGGNRRPLAPAHQGAETIEAGDDQPDRARPAKSVFDLGRIHVVGSPHLDQQPLSPCVQCLPQPARESPHACLQKKPLTHQRNRSQLIEFPILSRQHQTYSQT